MQDRLLKLLKVVVEEYVETAEPVGSQSLVERHQLNVSPATIRNWFAELEDAGCLMQPHTSGGRVPTEKGFRLYIQHFVQPKPAAKRERAMIERAAQSQNQQPERLKQVAQTLAGLSGEMTVVGFDEADPYYTGLSAVFSQPEFREFRRVLSLSQALDRLEQTFENLDQRQFRQPQVLLGEDCPFGSSCGSILISVDGGVIGILGPVRMNYQNNMSLLWSAWEALEE